MRSCEANVFTKPLYLLSLIGLRAQVPEALAFTHGEAAPNIAKLLGTPAEAIESIMHPPMGDQFERPCVQWFGSAIERRHIDASLRRFAPRSLEEGQHYRAIWMARLLDFCPVTMEKLVSKCPQCSQPLGWRACCFLSKCDKCKGSLLSAKSQILPPHLHEAARLGAALLSPLAAARHDALSSLPAPFRDWSPGDALSALVTLGEAAISLHATTNASSNIGSADRIAAGIEFAMDWPNSLTKFARNSTDKSNTTSLKLGLGLLGKLFDRGTRKSPLRDLIRTDISASLGEASVPVKLSRAGLSNSTCRIGKLSSAEAAKELGVGADYLRRLEGRSGTFVGRHHVAGGTALYDKLGISRLATALDKSERFSDCARLLGISRYCLDAFISAGLVEIMDDADAAIVRGSPLISTSSIDKLRNRLRQQSTIIDGELTFREAMQRNGDPYDWVVVFNKMLSGHVRLRFADGEIPSVPIRLRHTPTRYGVMGPLA